MPSGMSVALDDCARCLAAIEWLLQTPTGGKIGRRIFARSESLHAPHLLDVELVQVMRRYVRDKTLSTDRAEQALGDLGDLALNRYPHDFLISRRGATRLIDCL